MWIENFITHYARRKNSRYLQFIPSASLMLPPRRSNAPLLLYMHVPFCEELCPYCSFNRMPFHEPLARSYFEALRKEILIYERLGYDFKALYVGGGTPTVLIEELACTVELIKKKFHVAEISVETNPNHLTSENLRLLRDLGVSRLSVGVQSFDDTLLKAMERYHKYGSGKEIRGRLRATQGQFKTLNVDMIFNFPTQTMETLEKDLATLIELGVDQVTYYPLMVSASTQSMVHKKLGMVSYQREKELYVRIVERLSSSYHPSTAWCFSRSEGMIDEYVVNYEEYAGMGSGSFGYLAGGAYANTFDVTEYIRRINGGSLPIAAKRDFSVKERARYDFLMKLFGLSLDLKVLGEKIHDSVYRHLWPEIFFFLITGGIRKQGHVLSLTNKGQYYWVIMMREFFIGVNNFRDYCREELTSKTN